MSSRSRHSTERKYKSIKLILICIVVFFIGYYLLNHVSTLEKPPLGSIFHIIIGCALMAASLLYIVIIIKKRFFTKKKSSKSRNVFLKDQQRNSYFN